MFPEKYLNIFGNNKRIITPHVFLKTKNDNARYLTNKIFLSTIENKKFFK